MTMPLPDIDEASWDQFTRERLQRDIQAKIDSFGLQQAIGEKVSGVQSLLGGIQAPPPQPAPEPAVAPPQEFQPFEPSPGQVQAAALATGQATPEPQPEPAPAPEPAPQPTPSAPVAAPLPQPSSSSTAPQPTTPSSGRDSWVAQMLANVHNSGGDIGSFVSRLNDAGGATVQNALAAASGAGANIQQFASNLTAAPVEQAVSAAGPSPGGARPAGTSVGGVPGWLADLISRNAPPELQGDPEFIRTVAAGAKAESGWDVNRVQNGYELGKGGGARGLFQFDMGGMGAPYAGNEQALLGQQGAELQASQIVPLYAKAYASAPAGLSGAEKASWVAAQAERPYQFDNPQSAARRNYASAYGDIGGGEEQPGWQRAGNAVLDTARGAVSAVQNQISQFGDAQLSNDEAYAACGPAAAVRFAQMYGRNPSLREATDLAKTVGWTSGGGMAGIGSEQALLQKMGIETKMTGDLGAIAREAQTGNPVTISTPGHYFFADGYDPNTGAFHVGQSGLDLKGGSEWMTPAQMEARMGKIQGALLADNPQVPGTSTADMDTNPAGYLGRAKNAISDAIGGAVGGARQIVTDVVTGADQRRIEAQNAATTAATDALDAARRQLDDAVRAAGQATQNVPDISPQGIVSAGQRIGSGQTTQQDQDVLGALEDFGRNGPIGYTRDRLRDVGSLVNQAPQGIEDLYQARQDLGTRLGAGAEDIVPQGIPVLSGAGTLATQLAGGFLAQPDFIESAKVMADMAAKYPLGGANSRLAGILPDINAMTPEDRQRYSDAGMIIGSMSQPAETRQEGLRPGAARGGELPPMRTSIAEGGLGTPAYQFEAGTPERAIAQQLRDAAQADPGGVARLSSEDMMRLPGMAGSNPSVKAYAGRAPALDDVRFAIDNGMNQAHWYTDFAHNAARLVGEDNINEFRSLFGITSQQTAPTENLQYTLGLMQMARDFTEQGKPFTTENVARWVAEHPRVTSTGNTGAWKMNTDQFKKVANLYNNGFVDVASNAKTSSYAQNVLSALQNRFDPNSTMDVWMQRLFNYENAGTSAISGNDAAYRSMRAVMDHLSGELGMVPHQAQAAAWFSIKAAKDFADSAAAPAAFKRMLADFEHGGQTTLGDVIRAGRELGVYDNPAGTWAHVAADPGVQDSIAKFLPGLDRERPATVDNAYLQYPAQTKSRAFPVTPEATAERMRFVEQGAPTVASRFAQDAMDALGYNPETRQFDALNTVPHIVQQNGDALHVVVPGGNVDALQYVGALVNKAGGADSMDLHIFRPEGTQLAGWKAVNPDGRALAPEQMSQLRGALDDANVQYTTGPGGIMRIHALPSGTAEYEARVSQAVGNLGLQLDELNGVAANVGSQSFDPILARFDARYGGAGRSSLQAGERGLGGPADLGSASLPTGPVRGAAAPTGDLSGVDFSNLASQVRTLTHEEARQLVGGAYDPGSAVTRPLREEGDIPPRGTPEYERYLRDKYTTPRAPASGEPITLTPGQETARLRLEDYPEEIRNTIRDHAQGIDWARLQRRGVVSDMRSQLMAERYAKDTTLDQTIREGRAGQAYNDFQIRALRNGTGAQAAVVRDLSMKIEKARALGAGVGDDVLHQFISEAEKLDQLTRIAEGARAESGRGLRAWQGGVRLQDLAPNEAIAQITKELGGDKSRLLQAIGEYQKLIDSGAGPVALARFWGDIKGAPVNFTDWIKLVRYNSMLSGPRTFEVNAISNALEVPWRLARDIGASTVRGRPGEIGAELSGAYAGLAKANRAFLDVWSSGISERQALAGDVPRNISNRIQNPVGRAAARALEVPTRLLGGADEWMRAIDYGMNLGREAGVQASKEGLRGDAWSKRVATLMAYPETAPNLMKRASAAADRMTYKGEMGNWGTGLQQLVERTGVLGNIMLPFLKTTYHITARGIDRSPLGLLGTGYDVLKGKYGSDLGAALAGEGPRPRAAAPLGERLTDNLVGSAIFTGLFFQAQQGNISGAGPQQAQDRDLMRSRGWQPYSVRIGDKWVSYANWGPVAIPLSLAAAASESQRFTKPGAETQDYIVDGARRTMQLAQEQTFLQSIGTVWKGLQDPEQYGSQLVNDTVTSMIPYGATLNTIGQAFDPSTRRVDRFNVLDAIQARLPGVRQNVPEAQDVLGRAAPNQAAGLRALVPLRVSDIPDDKLLAEMDRVGYAPPAAPKSITRGNMKYEMEPDEQRELQAAAGQLIVQRANAAINSPEYAKLNDSAKAKRLQMVVDAARTQAENKYFASWTAEDRQARRSKAQGLKEIVPVSGRG